MQYSEYVDFYKYLLLEHLLGGTARLAQLHGHELGGPDAKEDGGQLGLIDPSLDELMKRGSVRLQGLWVRRVRRQEPEHRICVDVAPD